jgi:cell division protein ZapA
MNTDSAAAAAKVVTIRVLDKDYQVACPTGEHNALLASARLVDEKMREIHDTRKMVGTDRVAVMAALNIAHDLLRCQAGEGAAEPAASNHLRSLQSKVEAAIIRGRQLEL